MLAGIENKRFLAGGLSDFLDFFLNIGSQTRGENVLQGMVKVRERWIWRWLQCKVFA